MGVVWKCWAGKVKVSPKGLIWEERGAESSSEATQKITITHNYSLKTVGKGALYLPVLAQHSTVPLIATLLLVHIAFCASCHILLRHAQGVPSVHFSRSENWTAPKLKSFWNCFVCPQLMPTGPPYLSYCRLYPPAAFSIDLTLACLEICPAALFRLHLEYSSVCCCIHSHGKGFDSRCKHSC